MSKKSNNSKINDQLGPELPEHTELNNDVYLDYTSYHDKFASVELEMLKENFSFFDKDGNGTI